MSVPISAPRFAAPSARASLDSTTAPSTRHAIVVRVPAKELTAALVDDIQAARARVTKHPLYASLAEAALRNVARQLEVLETEASLLRSTRRGSIAADAPAPAPNAAGGAGDAPTPAPDAGQLKQVQRSRAQTKTASALLRQARLARSAAAISHEGESKAKMKELVDASKHGALEHARRVGRDRGRDRGRVGCRAAAAAHHACGRSRGVVGLGRVGAAALVVRRGRRGRARLSLV